MVVVVLMMMQDCVVVVVGVDDAVIPAVIFITDLKTILWDHIKNIDVR